jgi:NADPH-dependent curcumin reductase CurA
MSGFLAFDYMHHHEEAVARLAGRVREGRFAYREDIGDGIGACPGAISTLYSGENMGKLLIRLGA